LAHTQEDLHPNSAKPKSDQHPDTYTENPDGESGARLSMTHGTVVSYCEHEELASFHFSSLSGKALETLIQERTLRTDGVGSTVDT
jgi:hypothetical protein